ncbi:MAG: GNAT family N-acetyltransferase [Candidatus Solibacter sp.]
MTKLLRFMEDLISREGHAAWYIRVDMGIVTVRAATPCDIPTVLSLLRELAAYEGKVDSVRIDERLLAEHAFGEGACIEVLLGLLDGDAVSYAIFFPHFGSYGGRPWLYLEDLYVQPGARGAGVGRAMMAHMAGVTLRRGWAGMVWSVLDWNEPAFAFYRGLGATNANGHVSMDLSGDALAKLAGEG